MHTNTKRRGTRLMDRPEYNSKPRPLTAQPTDTVSHAVAKMTKKNYGSVVILEADSNTVAGIVTERDILNKLVAAGLDPKVTPLSDIMTTNPRLARETDDMLDWLRIMSNERFRRLPVVDGSGSIKAVFTQGDFVSYTWPDLFMQMKSLAGASVVKNLTLYLFAVGLGLYSLAMLFIIESLQ